MIKEAYEAGVQEALEKIGSKAFYPLFPTFSDTTEAIDHIEKLQKRGIGAKISYVSDKKYPYSPGKEKELHGQIYKDMLHKRLLPREIGFEVEYPEAKEKETKNYKARSKVQSIFGRG